MNYIPRKITPAIVRGGKYFPVVVITGPLVREIHLLRGEPFKI